ncbi:MAG: WbqC family protein [Myxococcales bacterium]|nr:WbqC family protein [Myxococcales bacterium]MCB9519719.1 WbqC family protein [Myxococcales bacterium]MCB9530410.1 WbqC family protein [Myxococcales bacterium]MCB9533657.1 WbqC family protein [Myxococcales bacterium]
MTRVAIHQPQYIPWLPYLAKVCQADLFVLLDTTQYQKNGVQNRNQVLTAAGPLWLTIPVRQQLGASILETAPVDRRWIRKHRATVTQCYPDGRVLATELFDELEGLPADSSLADFAASSLAFICRRLDISTPVVRASALAARGTRTQLLISILQELGATEYLSGNGARAYQTAAEFRAAGIELLYQRFEPVEYPQGEPTFTPHLSALDLVLRPNLDAPRLLRECTRPPTQE